MKVAISLRERRARPSKQRNPSPSTRPAYDGKPDRCMGQSGRTPFAFHLAERDSYKKQLLYPFTNQFVRRVLDLLQE